MKKKILLISLLSLFVFIATLTMVFLLFSKPTNIPSDPIISSSSSESTNSEPQIVESPFEKIIGIEFLNDF
jgi:flagellar basal body-associated protein FliL